MTARLAEKPPSVVVPLRQGIVPRSSAGLRAEYEICLEAYLNAAFNGASADVLKRRAVAILNARVLLTDRGIRP